MKHENIHDQRLLKLARHIGKRHLEDELLNKAKTYRSGIGATKVEHFDWALQCLPQISRSWKYRHNGSPFLVGYEEYNALTAAAIWFDLNMDSLPHLFMPNCFYPEFGGMELTENSTPSDLAYNIYEFLSYRGCELQEKSDPFFRLKKARENEPKIINLKTNNYGNTNFMHRMRA